jgi:hypothetical protein
LADREDSVHIKIKIDVAEEDKQFVENLATNIEGADESKALKGEIKDIEKRLKEKREKDPQEIKKQLERKRDNLLLKEFKEGPVGMVNDFTSAQANNLRGFVTNPAQFLVAGITKKLGKYGNAFTKGGIIGIIALLVYETVLFVFDQLMQPGRPLDRRFRRIAQIETLNFYERTLQEEIRHGYEEIRVATRSGLRGGISQVNGNLFEFSSASTGILQSGPFRSSIDIYRSNMAAGSIIDQRGSPRRRIVFTGSR